MFPPQRQRLAGAGPDILAVASILTVDVVSEERAGAHSRSLLTFEAAGLCADELTLGIVL